MPQSDSIVTMTKLEFLLNADGSISLYGYFIKALVAGLLFYLFTFSYYISCYCNTSYYKVMHIIIIVLLYRYNNNFMILI